MPTFQQIDAWSPLQDAADRAMRKRQRHERGAGNHTGQVYASTAAMLKERELRDLDAFRRAAFEARYRFGQVVKTTCDDYAWTLRTDLDPEDIPF